MFEPNYSGPLSACGGLFAGGRGRCGLCSHWPRPPAVAKRRRRWAV